MSQVTAEVAPIAPPVVESGGVSGALRRVGYRLPEHDARHWLLLLLADRAELLEERLTDPVRRRPVIALAALAFGVLVGGALIRRWR
jgi:hypothetical protein